MSELVEIKAKLLKWCQIGFKFKSFGLVNWWALGGCDGVSIWKLEETKMRYAGLSMSATVEVNPKEYEQAVIERIKEMLQVRLLCIKKTDLGKDGSIVGVLYREYSSSLTHRININCDPRPWESEYTINLQEEDNE